MKYCLVEHKRAVKNAGRNNGLTVHVGQTGHDITWDEVKLVHRKEQEIEIRCSEHLFSHYLPGTERKSVCERRKEADKSMK